MSSPICTVSMSDVPANLRRGGDLRVLLSPRSVGATSGFMGIGRLAPGEFVAEHYHPYSEEFLCVTAGEVTVQVEDTTIVLGPDQAVMVPIGARHRIRNDGIEPASVVFHLSPLAPRPDLGHIDCETLPGPGSLPVVGG